MGDKPRTKDKLNITLYFLKMKQTQKNDDNPQQI